MRAPASLDYTTYREVIDELLRPIEVADLDVKLLKCLYESKLVYLEYLRVRCFLDINKSSGQNFFSINDYHLILSAISQTKAHLRDFIKDSVVNFLKSQKK